MRSFWLSVALVLGMVSLALSQITPANPATTPGTMPAAQDPSRPQNQMPPDQKAPAPVQGQSPAATPPAATTNSGPRLLRAGTDIHAALDTPLSTRTAKVGDRFTATVNYPVHDSSGNIIVPVGAKLNGQVSEPADHTTAEAIKDMSHLNLRFTDIQLADGQDIPLNVTLISIHNGKPLTASINPETPRLGSAAIAANGGFAGPGLGRPLKGLAVGNLPGGGYVLTTTGKQVDLPAECVLRLRVDRNTTLP